MVKKNENYTPDLIVQLRPTQPFRSIKLLQKAIELMIKDKKLILLDQSQYLKRTPFKMDQKGQLSKIFCKQKIFY